MKLSKIHMVDLHQQYEDIKGEVDQAIQGVLDNCAFINGPEVKKFTNDLANYTKSNFAVTCGNGTDALQIALMTLGLKPGDEVILPSFTYIATAEVCALLKLQPVFVDVDYDTFNLDASLLEKAITKRTKVVLPVHLFGQCAEMRSIIEISNQHNLKIVEDAAQAIGATYKLQDDLKYAGTIGDIGCLSFFPSKNLGCYGDGGAMLFNDQELSEKARMIANHGQSVKYIHDIVGCNSRLDTIQAAILGVKLRHLDQYIFARSQVAEKYNNAFANNEHIKTPGLNKNSTHVYHQYTLRVEANKRDKLRKALNNKGIPTMVYYPIPLHLQKAFNGYYVDKNQLPVSERLTKEVVSLPIHTEMEDEMVEYIIENVVKIINDLY